MSEEEIIKTLQVLIGLEEFNKLSYKENKAIQGLLDLYNKEKEKNIKYLDYQCKRCSNKKICKQNNWCVTMDRIPFICDNFQNNNSVTKDKIKEIIDKIDVEDYYCLNEAEEDLRKLVK